MDLATKAFYRSKFVTNSQPKQGKMPGWQTRILSIKVEESQ